MGDYGTTKLSTDTKFDVSENLTFRSKTPMFHDGLSTTDFIDF